MRTSSKQTVLIVCNPVSLMERAEFKPFLNIEKGEVVRFYAKKAN